MDKNLSQDDFARLFAQNERKISAYIHSLAGDWSLSEEVFQETCVVLWQKIDEYQPGTNFSAWACGIARYKFLKQLEVESRRLPVYQAEFLDAVSAAQSARLEREDNRWEALNQCVEKLSVRDRDLLRDRYAGNETAKSVAQKINRSVHTVYKSLSRIRESLRDCVKRTLGSNGGTA